MRGFTQFREIGVELDPESWRSGGQSCSRIALFWYYQARLRWTGTVPPPGSSADLLDSLETDMAAAEPEVQWAMNSCAGWIGVFESKLRPRCIKLGKKLGLYKDDPVPKNCTPSYLPEFIKIEAAKREWTREQLDGGPFNVRSLSLVSF